MISHQASHRLHRQVDLMSLEQKQKLLTKNKSPRRTRVQEQDFQGYIDQGDAEESSSSELGSLNDSTQHSEGEITGEECSGATQAGQALEFSIKVRKQSLHHDENVILLYVIKLAQLKAPQGASERLAAPFEFFKMRLDCAKCSTESENNEDLRKFKRRVKRKLNLGDNFKIFNYLGHPINEDELSYLNQGGKKQAVVHVSSSSHFDYDVYMRLFHELRKLGEGGFGQVFLGQHIITREQYAIKAIYPTVFKADEVFKAYKEAQVLQNLRHQSVIKLFNVIQMRDSRLVLFMEHLTGGTLKEHLDSVGGRLEEREAQSAMYEIGNALNYCHQRNIVHRDIKLENIMLRQRGELGGGLVIIDFGIAGKLQKSNEEHHEGTVRYVPPELITGTSYKADQAFDVWSLGILLYRLVYGSFPFDGANLSEIRASITGYQIKEPDPSAEVSDTCLALIRLMLNRDPSKRPKLYQLIQHEWFTKSKVYQQQQLMHQTVYQQSTLMGFFKQELRQIEQDKEQKQQLEARKSIKIVLNDEDLPSSLTREASYLGGISHLLIPNSREQRNVNVVEQKSTKKFVNVSPSPNVMLRGRPTFKFQAESGDYQALVTQAKKLPKEESISSLNMKKQQLSEMRNFIEKSGIKGLNRDIKREGGPEIGKAERDESHKRRNMKNLNSLMEAKSINQKSSDAGSVSILSKPSSFSRMVVLNNSNSKPPTQLDTHQKPALKLKQDPVYLRYQNDMRRSKLLGLQKNTERSKERDIEAVPELQSPLRANSGMIFGIQGQGSFEHDPLEIIKQKHPQSHLKSLNGSTIQSKVSTSMQKHGPPPHLAIGQDHQQLINPLIVKQHEYKKFVSKVPSQLNPDDQPLRLGQHMPHVSVLTVRDQVLGLTSVKGKDGGLVLPAAGERRQLM